MLNVRYLILAAVAVAAVFIVRDIVRTATRMEQGRSGRARSAETVSATAHGTESASGFFQYWQARHETGNLDEYSWWSVEGVPTGTVTVIPDPTGSGRGSVLRAEITASGLPGGDSHRIYPALILPECYRGGYRSTFHIWADLPLSTEHGWFSFATYTNNKEWKGLYCVNLGQENGETRLILFHTPAAGKGIFTRISAIPFPMRQWVKVEVKVDYSGIMLFQDDRLIAEAKKDWGTEGVGLCEAHWGLYAQDKNRSGLLLNDDITVSLDTPFDKPPKKVRPTKGKP